MTGRTAIAVGAAIFFAAAALTWWLYPPAEPRTSVQVKHAMLALSAGLFFSCLWGGIWLMWTGRRARVTSRLDQAPDQH